MSSTTNGTNDGAGGEGASGADGTRPVVPRPAIPSQDDRNPDTRSGAGWLGAGRAARRAHTRAVIHQASSVLLGYPDEVFFERLPLAARAAAELPRSQARTDLLEFCEHASTTPELALAEHYVEVFDLRRRRALHMTYYTDGDTRRRGHALAEVKRVYAEAGWRVSARELSDHLAVVLEFAARGDAEAGQELLVNFRPGLDLLSRSLGEHGTPYARVVDAVRYTLPAPRRADEERVRRLAQEGPPAEDVGMEPYGARPRVPLPLTDITGRPR
ncbi:nitrate reductase molybdenum cofactor assembly chaperone [Nocardiopsis metallicus]|uniref:Nitrate reductase delta subunit n=1 Tax=Nocardiopsis metallicus TaxID=179819 RepID=A0A840WN15_9ACTN|nr:nitrate reductase molybdenum cofactor assembly chaperone [Nocardiopsis metallicus]MBB5494391.1 nitrate reductase delta subunit [Nocardiopsis metallicus]